MTRLTHCLWASGLALVPLQLAADGRVGQDLLYGDVRVAAEANDVPGRKAGIQNYGSRIGFRYLQPLPTSDARTRAVFQIETGFKRAEVGHDGFRLLFAGVKSPAGNLTFGRQWSAFYETVGRRMDPGLVNPGLGYEGSGRVRHSLQYARLFGQTYLQVDAIADPDKPAGGFDRLQSGASYEGSHWRAAIAADLSRRDNAPRNELHAASPSSDALCDRPAVNCVGLTGGWTADGLSLDAGLVRATNDIDKATGATFTIKWAPNQFSYFAQLGGLNQPKGRRRGIGLGISYQWDPWISTFAEFSHVRKRTSVASHPEPRKSDDTLAVGVRVEFDGQPFSGWQ